MVCAVLAFAVAVEGCFFVFFIARSDWGVGTSDWGQHQLLRAMAALQLLVGLVSNQRFGIPLKFVSVSE